jgi:long-chain acyl-CoA synthetase
MAAPTATASPAASSASAPGVATTLNHLFAQRAATTPDRVALRRKVNGTWEDITWRGYREAARKVGLALLAQGVSRGQAVAVLSETRAEWAFCDLGILGVGAITVPIYHSNLAEEVRYIVENSGAVVVFVENLDQWAKLQPIQQELPGVQKFVLLDTRDTAKSTAAKFPFEGNPRVITYDAFLELGQGLDKARFDQASAASSAADVITFIYTSGTTGNPKGVVLTHGNAMAECDALFSALEIADDEITLAFLPLAHVFARVLHWMQLRAAYVTAFAESISKVIDNMGEVRPTFFAAVPRIYEKLHAVILAKVNENKGAKLKLAQWAVKNAIERDRRRREHQGLGLMGLTGLVADRLVVKKMKAGLTQKTGGRLRYFISGGAPLAAEIAGFFHTLGFPIYEGYGLTETTAATHLNKPGAHKVGTVGRAVAGVETRIASDGEILVKGALIMRGYHNNPQATAEVISADGWFATGDIGEVDADGFLRITDRKKDLLVNAAGKNIAPQNIENHLKTDRFISQAALFGDKQRFCVALLTLDEAEVRKQLAEDGVGAPATLDELVKLPRVRELLQASVDQKNKDLASYMQVKYFEILPKEFEVGDELTPSLKVRRKVVMKKYDKILTELFSRSAPKGE